jgi:environmental stress-induced protein Ves
MTKTLKLQKAAIQAAIETVRADQEWESKGRPGDRNEYQARYQREVYRPRKRALAKARAEDAERLGVSAAKKGT